MKRSYSATLNANHRDESLNVDGQSHLMAKIQKEQKKKEKEICQCSILFINLWRPCVLI